MTSSQLLKSVDHHVDQQLGKFASVMQSAIQENICKSLAPLVQQLSVMNGGEEPQRQSHEPSVGSGREVESGDIYSAADSRGTSGTKSTTRPKRVARYSSGTESKELSRAKDKARQFPPREVIRQLESHGRPDRDPSGRSSRSPKSA